jgi:RNA polymerase sigma factor (sigma-70 family)
VQTTLGKLYVAWPRVQKADSQEAYARGALTKTFLSHVRARRNSEQPAPDLGVDIAASADVTSRVELFDALRTLDPLDRAIVVLRYWNDRSVDETATEVAISPAAVRTRASRALAKLRTQLADGASDTKVARG